MKVRKPNKNIYIFVESAWEGVCTCVIWYFDPLPLVYRTPHLFYYCLLLRALFSYSVIWCDIVPEPTGRALYLTRQHYRKTVLEG
jgi:hypothetical protein